ncbi:hypothetical protein QUF54_01825 [Candidatus Marithioploca araucensis]|uniref:Uncharacterized protein n=1 Tax=Candidatus Marithioploca araucensis TaxID=70273 RepID=A0ABT7VQX5_9GAMM|nr:hypothetical protein [Candidatus Marithioploca araucensis]
MPTVINIYVGQEKDIAIKLRANRFAPTAPEYMEIGRGIPACLPLT